MMILRSSPPSPFGRKIKLALGILGLENDVTIEKAELEHSIVLAGSSISDLEYRIEASLIGKNVRIGRGPALPKAYRFVVVDNADVQIL